MSSDESSGRQQQQQEDDTQWQYQYQRQFSPEQYSRRMTLQELPSSNSPHSSNQVFTPREPSGNTNCSTLSTMNTFDPRDLEKMIMEEEFMPSLKEQHSQVFSDATQKFVQDSANKFFAKQKQELEQKQQEKQLEQKHQEKQLEQSNESIHSSSSDEDNYTEKIDPEFVVSNRSSARNINSLLIPSHDLDIVVPPGITHSSFKRNSTCTDTASQGSLPNTVSTSALFSSSQSPHLLPSMNSRMGMNDYLRSSSTTSNQINGSSGSHNNNSSSNNNNNSSNNNNNNNNSNNNNSNSTDLSTRMFTSFNYNTTQAIPLSDQSGSEAEASEYFQNGLPPNVSNSRSGQLSHTDSQEMLSKTLQINRKTKKTNHTEKGRAEIMGQKRIVSTKSVMQYQQQQQQHLILPTQVTPASEPMVGNKEPEVSQFNDKCYNVDTAYSYDENDLDFSIVTRKSILITCLGFLIPCLFAYFSFIISDEKLLTILFKTSSNEYDYLSSPEEHDKMVLVLKKFKMVCLGFFLFECSLIVLAIILLLVLAR